MVRPHPMPHKAGVGKGKPYKRGGRIKTKTKKA